MKKNTRLVTRKVKMLESELRMLQKYESDVALLHEEYNSEYTRDMSRLLSAAKRVLKDHPDEPDTEPNANGDVIELDPNSSNQRWRKTADGWVREDAGAEDNEAELDKTPKIDTPTWARSLYKKIAMASHPDRTSKDTQHEKLKNIFLKSAAAMDAGNFNELLGLALELDLDIGDDDGSMIPLLTSRIKDIKITLRQTESTPEWLWGEGLGMPQLRIPIANSYLNSVGIQMNSEDLVTIIQEVER